VHELLANVNTMIITYHSFHVKCRKYAYIKEATRSADYFYILALLRLRVLTSVIS